MTRNELINLLKTMPADATIHFGHDARDYCHTTIAPEVRSVSVEQVGRSDYFGCDVVVEEEVREDDFESTRSVVVLR